MRGICRAKDEAYGRSEPWLAATHLRFRGQWPGKERRNGHMTVIVLTRVDEVENMARFYKLDVQPTLFGEWVFGTGVGPYGSTWQSAS
jgi:hypothetical protein